MKRKLREAREKFDYATAEARSIHLGIVMPSLLEYERKVREARKEYEEAVRKAREDV